MGKAKQKVPRTQTQLKVVDVYNATRVLFPHITIDIILNAVYEKLDITTVTYTKHNFPIAYQKWYNSHKRNLAFCNMPEIPIKPHVNWFEDFVKEGGLITCDGKKLPTYQQLVEKNKDWLP